MISFLPLFKSKRPIRRLLLCSGLLVLSLCHSQPSAAQASPYQQAYELFEGGKPLAAKERFEHILATADSAESRWWALMSLGWYHDEVGEHRKSLDYSNRALEIALELDRTDRPAAERAFFVGRSLAWIAWAYKAMGHYDAAIEFYQEAIERGAPKGNMLSLHVWGLATQELGSIYYLRGDVEAGQRLIESAYEKAKTNNILTGIAECAALLAEISIEQGSLPLAARFAEEAVVAAENDRGSVYNAARARLVKTKVKAKERCRSADASLSKDLEELIDFANKRRIKRIEAEALLLKAQCSPQVSMDERINILSKSLGILTDSESELSGTAEARLGEQFLQNEAPQLAASYLKRGFRINEKILRAVDNAFLQPSLAELAAREGKAMEEVQLLEEALKRATSANLKPLIVETELKLADRYAKLGYQLLSTEHAKNGLRVAEELKLSNLSDLDRKKLAETETKLFEFAINAGLKTMPSSSQSLPIPP